MTIRASHPRAGSASLRPRCFKAGVLTAACCARRTSSQPDTTIRIIMSKERTSIFGRFLRPKPAEEPDPSQPAPACFFFIATATTETYPLSLHDALDALMLER